MIILKMHFCRPEYRGALITRNNVLILFFLILCSGNLRSQEKTVQGAIRTLVEIPVENVMILVKSSGQMFFSDSLGAFTVPCSATDLLTFSAEGFIQQRVRIKKESKYLVVNMKLKPGEEARELAIGYGHVREKNNLYAVSSHNDEEMDFSGFRNIYEVLEANFTGLQIIDREIIIRNSSSLGESNSSALLIVDGREVNKDVFENISTSDIARINILKDASASIYGVRGGNGVVIVETKRGDR